MGHKTEQGMYLLQMGNKFGCKVLSSLPTRKEKSGLSSVYIRKILTIFLKGVQLFLN